ncbi:hypothetical protein LMH87_005096 [Akanthomyces muscarius]|uniref:Uncharacterized protein n=1 Tax=Akanthomyces muscarius TaxID=2231603 RepID=A0A9W8UQ92_AKAMU|nr:hypothetical protein LMH87_005096 [Akanthomyces muscarius]KAJ4163361.1 hypothetical protein LMH87_005096 [Akanthomyces muscarius]
MQRATVTADGFARETSSPTRIAQRDVRYPTANLGSLNPTFTPPSSCASLTVGYVGHYKGPARIITFDYGHACDALSSRGLDPSCYPPRFAAAFNNLNENAEPSDNIYPVLSPASSCPAGYVSACGFTRLASSSTTSAASDDADSTALGVTANAGFESMMGQLLGPTQTAVGCCPSGYACFESRPYHCISQPSMGGIITADANSFCTSHKTDIQEFTAVSSTDSIYADAPCIVLVQDQPRTEPATATPSSTPSTSQTASSQTAVSSSSDLSTGGKAAIGVCVPLFAIFLGLAVFMFLRRRRSRRHIAGASADPDNAAVTAMSEAPANDDKAEMDGSDPRQSTVMESPYERGVSVLSDRSVTPSQSVISASRTSELYGSMPLPRLHEDVMELPADTTKPVVRKPVPEQR